MFNVVLILCLILSRYNSLKTNMIYWLLFQFSMFGFESKSSAAELIKELLICLNDFDVDTEVSNIQHIVDTEKRTNKIIENNSKNTIV